MKHTLATESSAAAGTFVLSVIIPFYNDPLLPHLAPRLEDLCRTTKKDSHIEFIVVDSRSDPADQEAGRAVCAKFGFRHLCHNRSSRTFSIGAARDFGAIHARGSAITFFDVDLRVAPDFWVRLLNFMHVFGISKFKKRFFTIPCLYLTNSGTHEFIESDPRTRSSELFLRWLHGDRNVIETFAPCSSFAVVDRLHYLAIGGHDLEFIGHGYEDFELYHRLISEQGVLPPPDDYYKDTVSWDGTEYTGFRSQFSLLGRSALLHNLVCFHLWHSRPDTSGFYMAKPKNRERLVTAFKKFVSTRQHPRPLTSGEARGKRIMFFGQPETNSARCLRETFPLLGEIVYANEFDFLGATGDFLPTSFENELRRQRITRVLFPNPYRNVARLRLYNWCRAREFPYLVFERGALPNSWFFDQNGFNSDSSSYHIENWRRRLSPARRSETMEFIRNCLGGAEPLEKQGPRRGGIALGNELQIDGKKVLFVPLQRPSDTVTVHMAGPIGSWANFLSFIDAVAEELNAQGWTVLCKRHPYETKSPNLRHARYVPSDTNFLDLLELADRVALMNSSVGLYAMMMEKPCFIFADCFYSFSGLNESVESADVSEFCLKVERGMKIDSEMMYSFIYFLKNEFYSFGVAEYSTRIEEDGSLRKAATGIDFFTITLPEGGCRHYERDRQGRVPVSAPIFERYLKSLDNTKLITSRDCT